MPSVLEPPVFRAAGLFAGRRSTGRKLSPSIDTLRLQSIDRGTRLPCRSQDGVRATQPYYWKILASNGQTLATSETYVSNESVKSAINSVKTNASTATVEDES